MFRKILLVALMLLLVFTLGGTVRAEEISLQTAIERSLATTAHRLGLPLSRVDFLQVASATPVILPDIGYEAYRVKIFASAEKRIFTYWYNADLVEISELEAFNLRAAAYETEYGRLSRSLHAIIDQEIYSAVPVAIWANQTVNNPQIDPPLTPPGPYRAYLPILSKPGPMDDVRVFLVSHGYAVDYTSREAPVVYATMLPNHIQELQAMPYVAAIYNQVETQSLMESATRTAAAPWTWERGITGSGIKVAVIESDGVAFDNPYINGSKYFIGWWPRVGSHATNVAGCIASTHSTQRGIAYDAEILSANALLMIEPGIVEATDWAIEEGANVLNASFGSTCQDRDISSIDKYFDWVVWNKKRTAIVSAGNLQGKCPNNYNVSSPGKAYNVITVGAKDDQNTADSVEDVKDDQFSHFSLYVDPATTSENRLKPEVVTTGENIITTSENYPWIRSTPTQGTSFSAPIVSGEAALMMQRAGWLKSWPEAVKAGVMATARWTQLHDDENYDQMASVDKMGVGSIDTTAADNSLINNRIRGIELQLSDFTDGYYYDVPMGGCLAGERMRVVITWPSHPSRLPVNWILHDRLESDFDLLVFSPSGQMYLSTADEANYEIAEFIMPVEGTYTARILKMRWDDDSMTERIGFAYYCGSPLD